VKEGQRVVFDNQLRFNQAFRKLFLIESADIKTRRTEFLGGDLCNPEVVEIRRIHEVGDQGYTLIDRCLLGEASVVGVNKTFDNEPPGKA